MLKPVTKEALFGAAAAEGEAPAALEPSQKLRNWFSYHPPTEGQPERYERIRSAGLQLAVVIEAETPPSADQTAAIRKVREAVMTANAAIACGGV